MNHNCQIFTPSYIAKEMLDLANYTDDILEKYVLDNSCGDGSLLTEVVRRYITKALKCKKTKKQISKDLFTYIIGVEIDPIYVEKCKNNLTQTAKEYGINITNWNIICDDGLKHKFDLKFDFIVGNPPYIAYAMLNNEERKYVKENFKSCSYGKFDYSYAFIEKCLSLLSNNGKMVFITPSNMYKTQFGKELRKLMLPFITQIIDYSFEKVFKKVLTSPAITVFDKNDNPNLVYKLKLYDDQREVCITKSELKDKWYFFKNESKGRKRFGDYFKVSNSIATLCNEVYIINENIIEKYGIETQALKNTISPRSKKYDRKEYIIFPYKYDENNKLIRYEELEYQKQFPNTYKYLFENKDKLEKTNKDIGAKWFEFGRSQALAHLNQPKLLISTIATNNLIVYDLTKDDIPYSGLYIVPIRNFDLDFAKLILNKKSTMKYLKASGIVLNGTSIRISTKDIENLKF